MHEKLYSEGMLQFCSTSVAQQAYTRRTHSHSSILEAIEASLSTLSIDARKRAEKDSAKKEAKAAAAEARDAERRAEAMVYIKRVERNKRKYVTAVSGLEAHGHDLK